MQLKFIHTADLHLDTPFRGLQQLPRAIFNRIKNSSFHSFKRIIDTAIENNVDFILITGDLYDDEYRSLTAQIKLSREFERLLQHHIKVFVCHGNHDHLSGKWAEIEWPRNVYFFDHTVEVIPFKKNGVAVAYIYGFSYPTRSVTENMTPYYIKEAETGIHIGMLHGNLEGQSDHDPYAPFKIKQLLEKEFDYWALGHIHKRQILHESPPIVYPGNIQGRTQKETGEKGCYLVRSSENETGMTFIPTAEVVWANVEVAIVGIERIDHLIYKVEEEIKQQRYDGKGKLISLELTGSGPLHSYLQEENNIQELVELLNEGEDSKQSFVWVVHAKVNSIPGWDRLKLKDEEGFIGDLLNSIDEFYDYDHSLSALFNHRSAKKFLPTLTDEEKKELLEDAENVLLKELLTDE